VTLPSIKRCDLAFPPPPVVRFLVGTNKGQRTKPVVPTAKTVQGFEKFSCWILKCCYMEKGGGQKYCEKKEEYYEVQSGFQSLVFCLSTNLQCRYVRLRGRCYNRHYLYWL